MGLKLHEWLKKRGNEPSQALPRQISPFVTYGDIFPRRVKASAVAVAAAFLAKQMEE